MSFCAHTTTDSVLGLPTIGLTLAVHPHFCLFLNLPQTPFLGRLALMVLSIYWGLSKYGQVIFIAILSNNWQHLFMPFKHFGQFVINFIWTTFKYFEQYIFKYSA